ncbi:MAG: PLP-dependent transferase [Microthrixaceae bacterium]
MTGFSTEAVHAGVVPDPATGAMAPPIHLASTFAQDGVGNLRAGYEYSRSQNPTRENLESAVASLEKAAHAFAFSSGLAALDAVLRTVEDHSTVVCTDDAYGGTLRLLSSLHRGRLDVRTTDLTESGSWEQSLSGAALVIVEIPTNPMLRVTDIAALAQAAHAAGARLVVDSTFATPFNLQPLTLGADVVVHSATKYISGHSDVVSGLVALSDDDLAARIAYIQNAAGAVPSPFDCYLLLRGIRTLGLRMERHAQNAQVIAEHLQGHPAVTRTIYPGLASHPQHDLASSQLRTPGGMVSFLVGSAERALRVVESTRLFTLAESLGAVESLIEVPSVMTHASLEAVAASGIAVTMPPVDLIRASVGIEDVEDLVADLDAALSAAD